MEEGSVQTATPRRGPSPVTILAIAAGIVLLLAANAHLVYVSITSQPECVPHLRAGHSSDGYSAARSSC